MLTKKELFINSAKLIDIDGRTNIPTVLLYEGNKHFIGYEAPVDRLRHLVPVVSLSAESNGGQAAMIGWESSELVAPLERCSSPHILNEDFKIELRKEDPTRKRFETAAGQLRSSVGFAKDFIDSAIELSKQ